MTDPTDLEKQLQEILVGEDFTRLDFFKDPAKWPQMTLNERDLLAMSFVAQGELQLKQGNQQVLESFELASRISPDSPMVQYRQAMSYALQTHNMRGLTAACQALDKAIKLDSNFFKAWSTWGCVLVRIGMAEGELSYFQEANSKFEMAYACMHHIEEQQRAELYWQWGMCWASLGKISGEAHDFHVALGKYREAAMLGLQYGDFWRHYGDASAELAVLMGKTELFLEAVELFRNAVKCSPDSYHAWCGLACSFQRLFEYYGDVAYFDLANDSFERAAALDTGSVDLWLNWGILLAESGKSQHEIEHFQLAFEKFARANACEENHPQVMSRWGEAQMFCGAYTERVELLREAESKLIRSLEVCPESADAWYIYGSCLNELARYFGDAAFYHQAAEKFQYGLTLNPSHVWLWHGLALSHFAAGELLDDAILVEKAVRYCAKVIDISGQTMLQFWNDWGVSLMKLSEMTDSKPLLESAIEKFEKAVGKFEEEKYSCDLEWLYNYGCAMDLLGSYTDTSDDYETATRALHFVVQEDPTYQDARYNLALALSHLGESTNNVDELQKALEHFQILLTEDPEAESAWHDWGMALISLAKLVCDQSHPEKSRQYYAQAEEKLMHALALGCLGAYYSLVCLSSLTGNVLAAMHYLERAEQSRALPSVEELMHDEWLENLRQTSDFRNFISFKIKDKG